MNALETPTLASSAAAAWPLRSSGLRWSSAAAPVSLAVAALLTGCFGGGGDDGGTPAPGPVVATAVPDSALASSNAFTQFTAMTSQSSSETAEPLTASNVDVPPSSDSDEPVPVT